MSAVFEPIASDTASHSHRTDDQFPSLLGHIQANFDAATASGEPLFRTDAPDLFSVYLNSFPPEHRQYHNCDCCRSYFKRFANLVTIDEDGRTTPVALGGQEDPGIFPFYTSAIRNVRRVVANAKVIGVFVSPQSVLGHPEAGGWSHFNLTYRAQSSSRKKANTEIAKFQEEHKMLRRSLRKYPKHVTSDAARFLALGELNRSEKVLGVATWFNELRQIEGKTGERNIVWRAVAKAPAGWCHISSSMIGSLLDDLGSGISTEEAGRRFNAKMHPLNYQRPQAAPKAGTIKQAEQLVEELGVARSLERRHARLEEIHTVWAPPATKAKSADGSVFGHLKPAQEKSSRIFKAPEMRWAKFCETVLPKATSLKINLNDSLRYSFGGFTTAVHADAPPILQWDIPEQRNPVCTYGYAVRGRSSGSYPHEFNLKEGWVNIIGVAPPVTEWTEFGSKLNNFSFGPTLILEGARDVNSPGLCLFPETMKSEFHSIRSVFEAHSNSIPLAPSGGTDVAGLRIGHNPIMIQVETPDGVTDHQIVFID